MWLDPPEHVNLREEEAQVWRADLAIDESVQNSFLKLLSPDEIQRAGRFHFEKDRRNYIAARGILRSLIGKYLEIDPAELSFQYSKFGKPGLADDNSLRFNVSHAENVALFAFTTTFNIGVDIEYVNPNIEAKDIASNFFSTNEVLNLFALPEEQQALGFFNCWTRKEAFIKAVGEGLSFPLHKFEVSLEPGKPAKLLATDWDTQAISNWSMYSMIPGGNFVGCLAIEGLVDQVKFWNWQ